MLKIIGMLGLLALIACGKNRDLPGAQGLKSGVSIPAPILLRSFGVTTSLGQGTVKVFLGAPDTSKVLGRVGTLGELITEVYYVPGAGGAPQQVSSVLEVFRDHPVFLESRGVNQVALSAYVNEEVALHLKTPLLFQRDYEFRPLVRYCGVYHFKGNSFLTTPRTCGSDNPFCFIPQPCDFNCRLDSQARLECLSDPKFSGPFGQPVYSRDTAALVTREVRAFECTRVDEAAPIVYPVREFRRLGALRVAFNPEVTLTVDQKPVHFSELKADLNLDSSAQE